MRTIIMLILIVAGSFCCLMLFYAGFGMESRRLIKQAGLSGIEKNGVKHVMAARTTYKALHFFYVPEADRWTLKLGEWNEWQEQYTKYNHPDSTLEMMKDGYNNVVGVALGQWELAGHYCKEEPTIFLAKAKKILFTPEDVPVSAEEKQQLENSRDVKTAMAWVNKQRPEIEKTIAPVLQRCSGAGA